MATTTKKTTTYRLASTSLVNAPGLLRWGQNGYKFNKDRANLLNVFVQGWGKAKNSPSKDVFHRLLMGEIAWIEEDGAAVFTV